MQARTPTDVVRRAQIVRAAIETINEVGYAKASFARIAKRAGLSSTGMISYHFRGRADLVAEVVSTVLDASVVYMRERIDAASTAPEKLRAYVEANLEFVAGHRGDLSALVQILQHGRSGDDDSKDSGSWYPDAVDRLEAALRAGQAAGEFGDFDPRVMALVIRNGIDSFHEELTVRPDTDVAAFAQALMTIIDRATAP